MEEVLVVDAETVVFGFRVFLFGMLVSWILTGGYILYIAGDLKPAWKKTKEGAILLSLLGVFLIPLVIVVICETLGG